MSYDAAAPATNQRSPMNRADIEREIDQLHPASYRWALGCCRRDREEAADVLQEVYLKVLDGKARFDGRSSFKTWLFSVIRRTAAERHRWLLLPHRVAERLRLFGNRPDEGDSARAIERSALSSRLIDAMRSLSDRQRELLELVFLHDMTIEEAAATIGIALGTARTHYDRGKKHLAALLETPR